MYMILPNLDQFFATNISTCINTCTCTSSRWSQMIKHCCQKDTTILKHYRQMITNSWNITTKNITAKWSQITETINYPHDVALLNKRILVQKAELSIDIWILAHHSSMEVTCIFVSTKTMPGSNSGAATMQYQVKHPIQPCSTKSSAPYNHAVPSQAPHTTNAVLSQASHTIM
jgi:hypothetical protein